MIVKKKSIYYKGFTLAEVLVTLMIVGVVSSMTIPSIIKSFQNSSYKQAYRKAYSDLSQAVIMGIAEEIWIPRTTTQDLSAGNANFTALQQYFGTTKVCDNNNNSECWDSTGEKANIIWPRDGQLAFIDKSGRAWSQYYSYENIILVDTNGFEPPNKYGQDRWTLIFTDRNNVRIGSSDAISTTPEKVHPFWPDDIVETPNAAWCPSPPCYFYSWLRGTN